MFVDNRLEPLEIRIDCAHHGASARWSPSELAQLLRTIGVEWCVLSSDLGNPVNAMPTDGFGEFMPKMLAAGMTERELAQMTKDNPARLLGLPVN